MEQKFIAAWMEARAKAEALGARFRPLESGKELAAAHRQLTGARCSEGYTVLENKGRLDLSLEALAVDKRFTGLFSDEEADTALSRLLDSGYYGPKM